MKRKLFLPPKKIYHYRKWHKLTFSLKRILKSSLLHFHTWGAIKTRCLDNQIWPLHNMKIKNSFYYTYGIKYHSPTIFTYFILEIFNWIKLRKSTRFLLLTATEIKLSATCPIDWNSEIQGERFHSLWLLNFSDKVFSWHLTLEIVLGIASDRMK